MPRPTPCVEANFAKRSQCAKRRPQTKPNYTDAKYRTLCDLLALVSPECPATLGALLLMSSVAMPRLSVVVMSVLLGATLSLPAAAQWKWRDKSGQTQYSDLPPPPGVAEKDILQRPSSARRAGPMAAAPASAASAVVLAAPKAVEPELEAKRRKAEQERVEKKKAEEEKLAAARADNCVHAKSYLRTLEDGGRVARTNANGEREILDDQARASEMKRARDVVASDCK